MRPLLGADALRGSRLPHRALVHHPEEWQARHLPGRCPCAARCWLSARLAAWRPEGAGV